MKIHPKDYKYVPKDPEKGFDAKRNHQIIDEVIEETDTLRAKKQKAFADDLAERTDAVATYFTSLQQGGRESSISKYFGRKYLLYLRGQEIMQKLQKDLTIMKNGKVIKRAGD